MYSQYSAKACVSSPSGCYCVAQRAIINCCILSPQAAPITNGLPLSSDLYYQEGNIRCLRCPAGTFVEKPCTKPDTIGECSSCHTGSTYSEGPTGLDHCLTCLRCRDDQEEVRPCTATQNAECRCKKGTYCPIDHPCEVCLTCTEKCPPGQELQFPCNSTSDSQCGPAESGSWIVWLWLVLPLLLLVLIVVVLCKCRKQCKGENELHCSFLSSCVSKITENPGREENPLIPVQLAFAREMDREEQETIFRQTWDLFVEHVPMEKWAQFMRSLRLSDNTVWEAKENNRDNAREQNIAMLRAWYQQNPGDVNDLLASLHDINLHTPARTIASILVQKGDYVEIN
uniref:Tumor necrosis factor receptor superfamily member 10b n=1 Tax=Xenopus tropicalis TaxID=8364 RepID=A0A6I8Q722_XENTR